MNRYLLLVLFFSFPAYSATIYQWIDEKGITHFSQTPPPRGDAREIQIELPPQRSTQEALEKLKAMEERPSNAEASPDKQKQAEEQARIRNEVCSELSKNLETLERYPRLYRKDAQGNIVWITEEQRQKLIEQTKGRLEEFCAGLRSE